MMTTAVFLFAVIYVLNIQNVESSAVACPKQVTGIVDGTIHITCSYSIITKANKYSRKFFCQQGGRLGRCKTVTVSTTGYVNPEFYQRAFIEDNRDEGTITITLTNLKITDQGTYICGINQDIDGNKDVISVAVTKESIVPVEAQLAYGQLRGTMKFRCEFNKEYADQRKYLCKIEKSGCRNIIDSLGKTAIDYQGRILLQTDKAEPGSFTVKIIQLRNEDSGYFSCGWGTYAVNGDTINFDLRINEETDIPQGSQSLSPRLGGSVSAQCNYNPKKNYTDKFWCKLEDSVCNPIIKTDGYVKEAYEGRVLIHDNPTNGTMQVLMNQITKEDEGWYWCVLTDGKHDQTSTVQLQVSGENLEGLSGNKTITLTAGEKAKIPCSYPCRFKSYEKYWCKWSNTGCKQVTSQDDGQKGLSITCETQELVLNIDSVSHMNSGWYWCGIIKSGRYGETMAVQIIVQVPTESRGNINPRSNVIADNRNNQVIVTPSSNESGRNGTLIAVIISISAAVLVVSVVFVFFRMRRKRNSDLVSVGSYKTNISMTDLDNDIGKENPAVIETQETDISHSKDGSKVNKKGSQDELDYSSFLIHRNGSPNEDPTS